MLFFFGNNNAASFGLLSNFCALLFKMLLLAFKLGILINTFFELNNVFGATALSFFIFDEGILLNELFDLVIFIDFTKYFG